MIATAKFNYNKGYRLPPLRKEKEYKERSQFVYALIYYRKEILLVSIVLFIILSGLFIASCKEFPTDFVNEAGKVDVPGLLGLMVDDGGWIDFIMGVERLKKYETLLKITVTNGSLTSIGGVSGSLSSACTIIEKINDLFQNIAVGLMLIFWGYGFSQMLLESNGQLILEQVIKKIVFLVVGYEVIRNSMTLCSELVNWGTSLMTEVVGNITYESNAATDSIKKMIFNDCYSVVKFGKLNLSDIVTTFKALGWFLELIFPWLISWGCDLIIQMLCWSRAIEICIFIAIAPIMFIDLGTTRDLTHSSTARALKNLLSLSMQGALIMLSLTICNAIMIGILKNSEMGVGTFFDMALVSLLRVGTISKTQSVAKQALGV